MTPEEREAARRDVYATVARIHLDPGRDVPLVPDRDPDLDLARGRALVEELELDLGTPTPEELETLGHSARAHDLAQTMDWIADRGARMAEAQHALDHDQGRDHDHARLIEEGLDPGPPPPPGPGP